MSLARQALLGLPGPGPGPAPTRPPPRRLTVVDEQVPVQGERGAEQRLALLALERPLFGVGLQTGRRSQEGTEPGRPRRNQGAGSRGERGRGWGPQVTSRFSWGPSCTPKPFTQIRCGHRQERLYFQMLTPRRELVGGTAVLPAATHGSLHARGDPRRPPALLLENERFL